MRRWFCLLIFSISVVYGDISPVASSTSVPGDADDCAIWVDPRDSARSVVIGNDKKEMGALYVWDLKGNLLFRTEQLNEPVNPDVRQNVRFGNRHLDIVGCGIRGTNQIKLFTIDPESRELIDITTEKGISSFHPEATYGFTLYLRPRDGKLFAFVSRKAADAIHQILVEEDGSGKLKGTWVRSLGKGDQKSFVEGMCVDDELGYLYCCDERQGVLKYHADPDLNQNSLVSCFATDDGIVGDREGIALYEGMMGTGYLLLSSQGNSTLKVYRREGANAFLGTIEKSGATETDGIAITSRSILPGFPYGLLVCHNDAGDNFALYRWEDVQREISRMQYPAPRR